MSTDTPMDPDIKRSLRDAFGRFATGVTVVTTRQPDGTPRGFTANSFTSVSLEPPLLLVCIGKTAHSCDTFAACDHFTVNILADDQKEISGLFASQSADKFGIADWHPNAQAMPLIDGTLANFSCARHQLVDAGDHLILIGRVLDFETADGDPLGYYKGAYFDIGLDRAMTEAATVGGVTIAAVLAHDNSLLLAEDANGQVTLPTAASIEALTRNLEGSGLTSDLAHLYAVYRTTETKAQRIVYHGHVQGTPGQGLRFHDLGTLPLNRVPDDAERALLRRYAQENRHGTFGIYHGTEVEGVVHTLAGNHKYHI
ncbi:flavin reductase family protein [uncultured Sulfitobacter sp.]|uniref:flavin reductase family protein n=1 Tax=uncultured Sulfitobacter sp. TaxID=191468 RepID=UPI002629465D|nr:flavin reductase family protein [uncultured Sulfitobacter sp.]